MTVHPFHPHFLTKTSLSADAMAQEYADKAQSNINFNLFQNSSLQTDVPPTQGDKETVKSDQMSKNERKLPKEPFPQIPIEIKPNRHVEKFSLYPFRKISFRELLLRLLQSIQ